MTKNEYAAFIEEILEELVKLTHEHKVNVKDLEEAMKFHTKNYEVDVSGCYLSEYNNETRCIGYALRYGIKTSYQTWLNLKKGSRQNYEHLVLLGGGCAFELLTMMKFTKSKRLNVTIIDCFAENWQIFRPLLQQMAQKVGIRLMVRYVKPKSDINQQIINLNPDLIIASNMLNELDSTKIRSLRPAFEKFHYYVQDLHFVKMKQLLNVYVDETQVEPFPKVRVPEMMAHLDFLGNFGAKKMYYKVR